MAEKFQSVAKHIKPQIQKAAQTANRINSKKCTHRCITVKLLKTKDREKKKSQKQWDRNGSLFVGGKQFSWQIFFFIRTYGDQEKEAQHFSGAERKELST